MAANDKERLQDVSTDGTVTVIRLDPLSDQSIKDILAKRHGVEDAAGFVAAARDRGIYKLLRNPQNLEMLARSVSQGTWPDSRRETFEGACRMLVRETNGEHSLGSLLSSDEGRLMDAAGRICAVQLLAGGAGYTLPDRAVPNSDYPSPGRSRRRIGGRGTRGRC